MPKFVADSVETTGLKWVAPAAGGANWSVVNSGGTNLTGAQTITVSGISAADKILVLVEYASSASVSSEIRVRLNTDTGNNYYQYGFALNVASTYNTSLVSSEASATSGIVLGRMGTNAAGNISGFVLLSGCNSAGVKAFNSGGAGGTGYADSSGSILGGYYNSASTISSVSLFSGTGNFDSGKIYVYKSE